MLIVMVDSIDTNNKSNSNVVMVGAFPPPMHGMAAVNSAVLAKFIYKDVAPLVIDISANSLERSLSSRLGRLPKVLSGMAKMLFAPGLTGSTLYMSVSGGFGQLYEILFLLLARLRKMRVYMHHHSFAYIERRSRLTQVLTMVAGGSSVHIVLSAGMGDCLQKKYSAVCRVVPISNAVFFSDDNALMSVDRAEMRTIGFISNISEEKGIFEFLDLVKAYEEDGVPITAKFAGPFQDDATERLVRLRLVSLDSVEYVGSVYGSDKESFYNSIDALVFPTKYVNEAEPLTIHEAMRRSLPVIAYGRGCIPEIVNSLCCLIVSPNDMFVPAALSTLKQWYNSPEMYRAASRAAGDCFSLTLGENVKRWSELSCSILGQSVCEINRVENVGVPSSKV